MTALSVGVGSGSLRAQLLTGSTRTAATYSSLANDSKQVKWTSDDDWVKNMAAKYHQLRIKHQHQPLWRPSNYGTVGRRAVDVVTGWDTTAVQEYID